MFPRTAIFFDVADDGGSGATADPGLGDIAPDATTEAPPVDEWAEPAELAEGLDTFDRTYVETLRKQAADYRTRAREYHDKFDGIDPEKAKTGMKVLEDLQTDSGVIQMFYDTGKALGRGTREMEALFNQTPGTFDNAAAATEEDEDLDIPLTKREVLEILQKQVLEPQQADLAARQEAEFQAKAQDTLRSTFDDLKVTDESERMAILALADQIIDPGKSGDLDAISAAVRTATTQWNAAAEKRYEAYIAAKREQADGAPASIGGGGGAAAGAPDEPPKSLAEAIERRRQADRASKASV